MATDANVVLTAAVSRSTTLSSTAITIGATPRRGLKAHVAYTSAHSSMSGSGTVTWSVDASYDSGGNFSQVGSAPAFTATTTQTGADLFIPFEVSPTDITKPVQVRLVTTISGLSGSGATIVYTGDLTLGRPS